MAREAGQATKKAENLQKEAEKLARQWRREEDLKNYAEILEVYDQKVTNWEEQKARGGKGYGHKPAKPKKPKVRRDPLMEDELSAAMAAVMVRADECAIPTREQAIISRGGGEQDADDNGNDGRNNNSSSEDGSGSESGEQIEWDDQEFTEEEDTDSE